MSNPEEMVHANEGARPDQIDSVAARVASSCPQFPATFEDQIRVEGKIVSMANRKRTRSQYPVSTGKSSPPKKRRRRSRSQSKASKGKEKRQTTTRKRTRSKKRK